MKNHTTSKINESKSEKWLPWILIIALSLATLSAIVSTHIRFDSHSTIINAMAMNPNYTEISYSELDNKFIAARNDDKKAEFKLTEASFKYLQPRLEEENKSWGDWEFKYQIMPPGKDHDTYKIYIGTRKPKQ